MSVSPQVSWFTQAVALFKKDVRAELRTRVAVSAIGVFTFSSLLLLALATAKLGKAQSVDLTRVPDVITFGDLKQNLIPAWDAPGKMGLLWVLLCFAAFTGLAHSFVHEEETGAVTALRLTIQPEAVFVGKLAFNLITLAAVAALVTPIYMYLTGMPLGSPLAFLLLMGGGCAGLAGAATIIAALAAKAGGTAALYPALGLPLLIVFLMLLLNAAQTVFTVDPSAIRVVRDIGGLLSFGVLLITLSVLLFSYIWEE